MKQSKHAIRAVALLLAICLAAAGFYGCTAASAKEEETVYDYKNVKTAGGANDGSTDISSLLVELDAQIKPGEALYFPAGTYLVASDMEIGSPVVLAANVKLQVEAGAHAVFNGPVESGQQHIFTGEGTVRLNSQESWGYPKWFGVKNNGREADDEAFQKAVDSCRMLRLPNKAYRLSGIVFSHPITVEGIGSSRITIQAEATTKNLFTFRSSDVSLKGLCIKMGKAGKDAHCFYFDTDAVSMENISLKQVYVDDGYVSFTDAGSGKHTVSKVNLTAVDFRSARDTCVIIRDFASDLVFTEVVNARRENKSAGVYCNMPGFIIENVDGFLGEHMDTNGEANAVGANSYEHDPEWPSRNLDGHGIIFRNCKNVKIIRTLMEYVGASGFIFENCSKLTLENCEAYTVHRDGFRFVNCTDSNFYVTKAWGNCNNNVDGNNITMIGCSDMNFYSVQTGNTKKGAHSVYVQDCKNILIDTLMMDGMPTADVGFVDAGGNENVLINNMTCTSMNLTYTLTGKGVKLRNVFLPSNTYIAEVTEAGTR
ncbi:MAG: hypothetical protein IKD06_03795 [Clostridia bacterium]|nr:hypothetical protein [Clostridia bacterium]